MKLPAMMLYEPQTSTPSVTLAEMMLRANSDSSPSAGVLEASMPMTLCDVPTLTKMPVWLPATAAILVVREERAGYRWSDEVARDRVPRGIAGDPHAVHLTSGNQVTRGRRNEVASWNRHEIW